MIARDSNSNLGSIRSPGPTSLHLDPYPIAQIRMPSAVPAFHLQIHIPLPDRASHHQPARPHPPRLPHPDLAPCFKSCPTGNQFTDCDLLVTKNHAKERIFSFLSLGFESCCDDDQPFLFAFYESSALQPLLVPAHLYVSASFDFGYWLFHAGFEELSLQPAHDWHRLGDCILSQSSLLQMDSGHPQPLLCRRLLHRKAA
jgi:hypothetical protein